MSNAERTMDAPAVRVSDVEQDTELDAWYYDDLSDFMQGAGPLLAGSLTYSEQIQPIYHYYCTPCHKGSTPTGCEGETCFVSFYEALLFPAYNVLCVDMNKAECGLLRIMSSLPESGFPDSDKLIGPTGAPIVLEKRYYSSIKNWIDAGFSN